MNANRIRWLPLVALSTFGTGCDSGAEAGSRAAVLDSAGIAVVVNELPGAGSAGIWRVADSPSLRIGGPGAPRQAQFHRLVGAIHSGGQVVVADGGSGELRWFDGSSGAHLATAGGAGEGPGEFRALSWLGRGRGDTVHAWDGRLKRLSTFAAGEFVRGATPPLPADRPFPVMHGILDGGILVGSPGPTYVPEEEAGVQRPPLPLWLITADAAAIDSLGPFPGRAVNLRPAANRGWIRTEVPFGPGTLVAGGLERVVVGDNAAYQLRFFTPTGELARITRVRDQPRPVTTDDLRRELERRLASVPPVEGIRAGVRASFEETPAAELMPAFDALHVDRTGHVWVRRDGEHGERPLWHVFDADGILLGEVRSPEGLAITEIGQDYVLGIWTDALDVEQVRAHPLFRDPEAVKRQDDPGEP